MLTLILIFTATFLFLGYFKHKYSYWSKRGVPGPTPIPFLGTIVDENRELPDKTEKRYLEKYGECFGTYYGTAPVFNTSNIDHMKQILTDLKTFPSVSSIRFNDRYLKHSIFMKSGSDWKSARSAQTLYYTSSKFKQLFGHFETVTANFLDNIKDMKKKSDEIEVKRISKFYGLDIIAKILFAIDVNSFKQQDTYFVKNAYNATEFNVLQAALITILPYKISKLLGLNGFNFNSFNELGNYFKKMMKERRKSGIKYNDVTELMQDAVDENKAKLTEEEIIGNALLSFFAGAEAVASALSAMIYYLAEKKDLQDRLYDEIEQEFSDGITYEKLTQAPYLNAFFQEVLRFKLSFHAIARSCSKDVQLGEYKLEKGTEIRILLYAANISPGNFYDPMTFNPDRWLKGNDNEYNTSKNLLFSFGYGPKLCLGQRLAMVEIKYLIVRILQNFVIDKGTKGIKESGFRGVMGRDYVYVKFNDRK